MKYIFLDVYNDLFIIRDFIKEVLGVFILFYIFTVQLEVYIIFSKFDWIKRFDRIY